MERDSREMQLAVRAARVGGDVVARYYREGVAMRASAGKDDWNLVSDADVESERAIAAAIRETFPDHAILGAEEQADAADAEHLWVIDRSTARTTSRTACRTSRSRSPTAAPA